jgi:hypothetical protein
MWNNKFWLKPPPSVTEYDYVDFGDVYRPYIKCELDVDFNANRANAHKIIQVANLDTRMIVGTGDGSTFRSHALLFDSLDNTPVAIPVPDHTGAVNNMQHYTIAHELGHTLGLEHIGLLLKTPLCQTAVALQSVGFDGAPETAGGSNSILCYGWNQPKHIGENVMGYGASFSIENARPWVTAIMNMRANFFEYWEILLAKPTVAMWLVSPRASEAARRSHGWVKTPWWRPEGYQPGP